MMPIGPLMTEHRLIERMIARAGEELSTVRDKKQADERFVEDFIDFIRTYADRCHHGKEEDLLFAALEDKDLSAEHQNTLEELIGEHVYGREVLAKLETALKRLREERTEGEAVKEGNGHSVALGEIALNLEALVSFYPRHIDKEDGHFFIPSMEYFEESERDAMLEEMRTFDQKLIHEVYEKNVAGYEQVTP